MHATIAEDIFCKSYYCIFLPNYWFTLHYIIQIQCTIFERIIV